MTLREIIEENIEELHWDDSEVFAIDREVYVDLHEKEVIGCK